MFSLTLMSKGEKRCGLDATVGGLRRIVQPFRVSINAKGGDCWHVFIGSVCLSLMARTTTIDGKQEKHKLRRRSEQYAEIKAQKEKRSTET
jgi:hypothetical protein